MTPQHRPDATAALTAALRERVLVLDGAMGTMIQGHGLAEIALKMPDGSSPQTAFDVSFSPDGERTAFSLASPDPGLYTARTDGRDVTKLTDSPDSHHANWGAAPGS